MRKILYHGSLEIISTPMYGQGKVYNDYGQGRRVWSWRRSGRAPSERTAM